MVEIIKLERSSKLGYLIFIVVIIVAYYFIPIVSFFALVIILLVFESHICDLQEKVLELTKKEVDNTKIM